MKFAGKKPNEWGKTKAARVGIIK